MPYDSVTGEVDQASVSADGSVYTEPKYMTVVVTGASGDPEQDDKYTVSWWWGVQCWERIVSPLFPRQ